MSNKTYIEYNNKKYPIKELTIEMWANIMKYKNIHYHKKEKNTKFKTKKINLPPDIINLIKKNVNIQQENRLKYII